MPLVPLGDVAGRSQWTIECQGRRFAVFVVDGWHYVTDAACPHHGGPLAEGCIRDERTVVCPWHWLRFDLTTGRCATLDHYRVGCYPVHERAGELFAEVPEPEPTRSWSRILRAHAAGER